TASCRSAIRIFFIRRNVLSKVVLIAEFHRSSCADSSPRQISSLKEEAEQVSQDPHLRQTAVDGPGPAKCNLGRDNRPCPEQSRVTTRHDRETPGFPLFDRDRSHASNQLAASSFRRVGTTIRVRSGFLHNRVGFQAPVLHFWKRSNRSRDVDNPSRVGRR